jgi:hypothetical protein
MTATSTEQYRPISTIEAGPDYPHSVRMINDLADSMNNYAHWFRPLVFGGVCFPEWETWDNTDKEHVIAISAGRYIPTAFTHLSIVAEHRREPGSNDDIRWRLYCNPWVYQGPADDFDSDFLGPGYTVLTWDSTSDAWDWYNNRALKVVRNVDLSYFVLTAQNFDVSSRGQLGVFSAFPHIG